MNIASQKKVKLRNEFHLKNKLHSYLISKIKREKLVQWTWPVILFKDSDENISFGNLGWLSQNSLLSSYNLCQLIKSSVYHFHDDRFNGYDLYAHYLVRLAFVIKKRCCVWNLFACDLICLCVIKKKKKIAL